MKTFDRQTGTHTKLAGGRAAADRAAADRAAGASGPRRRFGLPGSAVVAIALVALAALVAGTATAQDAGTRTAVFGGGCFWCMESPFDHLDGVLSTTSGFSGGHVENPSYEQVSHGGTGHSEVVEVTYDPGRVSYEELLYVYWRNVDPLDGGGQFCDRGSTYAPVIFTDGADQDRLARRSRDVVADRFTDEIAVAIRPFQAFYPAEDYHQDYYINNPLRYRFYRSRCGRDRRLEEVWGDEAGGENPPASWLTAAEVSSRNASAASGLPAEVERRINAVHRMVAGIDAGDRPYVTRTAEYDPAARIVHGEDTPVDYPVQLSDAQWRRRLDGERYDVLRHDDTERPFRNALFDNKEPGIYYSAATGQPLFSSEDKYESGTGWPSFTRPISPDAVAYFEDRSLFSRRIEVVDSLSGSHLGHVFNDGPAPTGQRYCMNSAALIFVPEGGDPPPMIGDAAR